MVKVVFPWIFQGYLQKIVISWKFYIINSIHLIRIVINSFCPM